MESDKQPKKVKGKGGRVRVRSRSVTVTTVTGRTKHAQNHPTTEQLNALSTTEKAHTLLLMAPVLDAKAQRGSSPTNHGNTLPPTWLDAALPASGLPTAYGYARFHQDSPHSRRHISLH